MPRRFLREGGLRTGPVDEGRRARHRPRVGIDEDPRAGCDVQAKKIRCCASALTRLLASLPDRSRMMVILRYQEEMEPGEIAAALNVPLGTVKSSLHRALAVLRKRIERTWKGVLQ